MIFGDYKFIDEALARKLESRWLVSRAMALLQLTQRMTSAVGINGCEHARVAERIVSCVERGEIGRANAMLSQATGSPFGAGLVGLQTLHPGSAHPMVIPSLAPANVPPLSPKFTRCACVCFVHFRRVARVWTALLRELHYGGKQPRRSAVPVRPQCCSVRPRCSGKRSGAHLQHSFRRSSSGSVEKEGSLRPIAVGSVLLRLGAKFVGSKAALRRENLHPQIHPPRIQRQQVHSAQHSCTSCEANLSRSKTT